MSVRLDERAFRTARDVYVRDLKGYLAENDWEIRLRLAYIIEAIEVEDDNLAARGMIDKVIPMLDDDGEQWLIESLSESLRGLASLIDWHTYKGSL